MTAPTTGARGFVAAMTAGGTSRDVAIELERRIEVIEAQERDDEGRHPWSGREIGIYLLVTVAAVAAGVVVLAL